MRNSRTAMNRWVGSRRAACACGECSRPQGRCALRGMCLARRGGAASVLRCVLWALHMLATSGIDPGCWRGWVGRSKRWRTNLQGAGARSATAMEASGRAELSCPWVLRLWLIVQGQRGAAPVWGGRASRRWGKFGCAPGWSAGDDMYEHVSTGGGVFARVITYARSRYCLG